MPRLTDKNEIRTRLRRDPAWSVYALGDLGPSMFPKTLWFVPDLTLVVQDFGTAILFAMGPGSVREALECVARPVLLQVPFPRSRLSMPTGSPRASRPTSSFPRW